MFSPLYLYCSPLLDLPAPLFRLFKNYGGPICKSHQRFPLLNIGFRTLAALWFMTKLAKAKIRFIKAAFALCLFSLTSANHASDPEPPLRLFVEKDQIQNLEKLKLALGGNKSLAKGYELQTLIALSYFPELKDVRIEFILGDVNIPLSSRPHWSSMLRSAKNRRYNVIIDDNRDDNRKALLLKNQPFNAQVGIIGHELAHTAYYLNRSFFGITKDALCQLSKCRVSFERNTDLRLIEHGLGWQRYDHALFVRSRLNSSLVDPNKAEGGGGAYMSPAEILEHIQRNEDYSETKSLSE